MFALTADIILLNPLKPQM